MRQSNTYPVDPSFKAKLLSWTKGFSVSCYLNSNEYTDGSRFKSAFDCFVGVDCLEEFSVTENSFDALKKFYERSKDWLFGFLSYDLKNQTENLVSENPDPIEMPLIHFFVPRYIFEIYPTSVIVYHHADNKEINDLIQEINNIPVAPTVDLPALAVQPRITKEAYIDSVEKIKKHILNGDIYELNYCQEFYVENAAVDPYAIYQRLNTLSPTPFSCFYKLNDKYLMAASPERFLRKSGQELISQPIKGTIRRGATPEEDEHLKAVLQNSPKERSENIMIVDLVRNDLARSAKPGTTKVDELFGIYTFRQVHQMISTVSSELAENVHFIDAIKQAFPMGSMTGAPKINAMRLIEKYETMKRGLYSGAVGYITPGGDFDFNVVIRSLLYNTQEQYLSFMVGSAITAGSIAESEYDECLVKAAAMLQVLKGS